MRRGDVLHLGPYKYRVIRLETNFAVLSYERDGVSYIARVPIKNAALRASIREAA